MESMVVLPEPLGPTRATNSPGRDLQRDIIHRVDGAVIGLVGLDDRSGFESVTLVGLARS